MAQPVKNKTILCSASISGIVKSLSFLTDLVVLHPSIWQSDQSESNQTRFMQEANQKNPEKLYIQQKVYAPITSGHFDVSQIIM